MRTASIVVALVLIVAPGPSAQSGGTARHPFGFDDVAALRSATPVAITPDGAGVLTRIDFGGPTGATRHEWRIVDADGRRAQGIELPDQFTPFGFTADGGLYGGYIVNKVQQLATVPMTAGKVASTPARVILLPRGIHSAVISPDGSHFAVLASPGQPDPLDRIRTVVAAEETSLYVVKADGTDGAWWCPGLKQVAAGPLAGRSVAWDNDGSTLAVLSQAPKIGFKTLHSSIDVCGPDGPRHVVDLAQPIGDLAWGGDGREIVFLSTTTDVLTPDHVWAVPAGGGAATDRTPTLDGSATGLAGDRRGHVWVLVAHGVRTALHEFAADRLGEGRGWPDGTVLDGIVVPELAGAPQRVALRVGDPRHTANVAVASGGTLQRITTEGDDTVARIDLGPVRVVTWKSKEGIALEGIATFPAGFQEGRRYPFVVLPHGGPESNDRLALDSFSRFVAGLGYVVLQPEYRGSTGYGSDFLQAIYQHFGDRAYRDVDSATDFAIQQGWADPDRLAMFGWSAGGFMTAWTVTQTSRYKAAIEGAGITDWASFMWTSDVQQWDYDGRWPDVDPAPFRQFSPVAVADNVTTPILILHGEADQRVPLFQGREFFEVLAARGKTTRMVAYPGSGHFPSAWEQRRDVFREIAAWLERYNPAH